MISYHKYHTNGIIKYHKEVICGEGGGLDQGRDFINRNEFILKRILFEKRIFTWIKKKSYYSYQYTEFQNQILVHHIM